MFIDLILSNNIKLAGAPYSHHLSIFIENNDVSYSLLPASILQLYDPSILENNVNRAYYKIQEVFECHLNCGIILIDFVNYLLDTSNFRILDVYYF